LDNIVKGDAFPLFSIRKIIPTMDLEINKILKSMGLDFSIKLEIEEKNTRSGNSSNKLNIYKIKKQQQYQMDSNGGFEHFIISFCFRIVLTMIASISYPSFCIIDEGFGTISENNIEKVQYLFDCIKNITMFDFYLIITHVDKIKDFLDGHLLVTDNPNKKILNFLPFGNVVEYDNEK